MLSEFFNRVGENGEILPLRYEKLNIGSLVNAIKLVLSDYEQYAYLNSVIIVDQVSEISGVEKIYLERLVAKSIEFEAKNGEVGSLEIEINYFEVNRYLPRVEIKLDVFFRINNISRKSKIMIVINLDSSNISLYISSFLMSEFATLGVGTDIMKILIDISEQTKLNLSLRPTENAKPFYEKNGFESLDGIEHIRNFRKNRKKLTINS
jgi:Acetyltransferase (GNAT) domain